MAEAEIVGPKLSEVFEDIWKIYQFVETCEDPLSSEAVQNRIHNGLIKAKKAVEMVNDLQLFSSNEHIEEVATNEIKYMLLPALLGYLTIQNTRAERINLVNKAKAHYTDYLRLCKNYSVTDVNVPDYPEEDEQEAAKPNSGPMGFFAMASTRQAKIEEFKKKKEMQQKLKELNALIQKETVDEDVKRDYYTSLLKQWVTTSQEEIDSINYEIPILEHMAKIKEQDGKKRPEKKNGPSKNKPMAFRPFILTKNNLQKQVFGAGYPSVPTYTIDEFYEQKVKDGSFQAPQSGQGRMSLQERYADPDGTTKEEEKYEQEKERKIEKDDEDELKRQREMDDWKDDHRRGWGNRKNML